MYIPHNVDDGVLRYDAEVTRFPVNRPQVSFFCN